MSEAKLECALDLIRRLPPQQVEEYVSDLIDLAPELTEQLLTSIDQPLKVNHDKLVGKDYLLCDYNRDGDSYRSPWSNTYDPPLEDGGIPSDRLRELEINANVAFDHYRQMYYDGGLSSVYLWDLDEGFAGAILIKKDGETKAVKGCWDSIHIIEVHEKQGSRHGHYKLTSTAMLWMQTDHDNTDMMNLGGSIMRQVEADAPITDFNSHIANIGRLIEDMENRIRHSLEAIYFGKTKDIVNNLRTTELFQNKYKLPGTEFKEDLVSYLNRKSFTE